MGGARGRGGRPVGRRTCKPLAPLQAEASTYYGSAKYCQKDVKRACFGVEGAVQHKSSLLHTRERTLTEAERGRFTREGNTHTNTVTCISSILSTLIAGHLESISLRRERFSWKNHAKEIMHRTRILVTDAKKGSYYRFRN